MSLPPTFPFFLSVSLSLSLNTDTQAPTVHITQPHGIWVKAAQGLLKLGRFPADIQHPQRLFGGVCVCVCSEQADKPVFLFFSSALPAGTHATSQANNSVEDEKKRGGRNKGQLTDSEQRQRPLRRNGLSIGKHTKFRGCKQRQTLLANCLFSSGNAFMQRKQSSKSKREEIASGQTLYCQAFCDR